MYDKQKGFVLIEALLLFGITLFLALLCVMSANVIHEMLGKGYDDHEQMEAIYQR